MTEKETHCPNCDKVFSFIADDVPVVHSSLSGSDIVQLECPHCGLSYTFDISDNESPTMTLTE